MPDRKLAKVTVIVIYTDGTTDDFSKSFDDGLAGKLYRFLWNRAKDFKDLSDTAARGLETDLIGDRKHG